MNYNELDALLQGRCFGSRKLANNTYAKRRYADRIAICLHATDILTFSPNGSITVSTGGWDTVTTRDRINRYLPKPWHTFGERGATILSNYRWYAGGEGGERRGDTEDVLQNSATINSDGTVSGGGSAEEYRDSIRREDNRRNGLRSKLRYWVAKARNGGSCTLTVKQIMEEENTQIRSAKIHAYGLERYFLEAGAEVLQQDGEYTLLRLALDQWENMTALKCVCPSTKAAYVLPVDPRLTTIDQALDWMFETENYRQQLVAES